MATNSTENGQPAKKMGCLKIGGIAVLIIIGLAILGSIFGGGETGGNSAGGDPAASNEPPVEVTAQELFAAYDANEAAAQLQYGDKRLLVSAKIASIDLDLMDKPMLMLRTSNEFMNAQASLTEASQAKAASLAKGQDIKLLCTSVTEVVGTPMLKGCEIQ